MAITIRSFAKINLGLCIGGLRADGFHELRTVYQTIALHDVVRVQVSRGTGIEIRCEDPRVPRDQSNTCWRIVERAMELLEVRSRVVIEIEKRLPVQGGLGGASGNAVAALLALEIAAKKRLSLNDKLRIAGEVGSDLPLFLIGGTVLGTGRGEEVYPLPDLAPVHCVVALPEISVSTPQAFKDWDLGLCGAGTPARGGGGAKQSARNPAELRSAWTGGDARPSIKTQELTGSDPSDRMDLFSRRISAWLSSASGVPVSKGRGRAETPLLDLVRTGIGNDFEKVVFPKYPELREAKSVLEGAGAFYASLSGSGSAIYGLFESGVAAGKAVAKLAKFGVKAEATMTLSRPQYWKKFLVPSS
jgi:4-diphosphocytidyl-2-C-methyl-D-erythritol kinase